MVAKSEVKHDEEGQFVELPPGLEFHDGVTDVEIVVLGNARVVTPIERKRREGKPPKARPGHD